MANYQKKYKPRFSQSERDYFKSIVDQVREIRKAATVIREDAQDAPQQANEQQGILTSCITTAPGLTGTKKEKINVI